MSISIKKTFVLLFIWLIAIILVKPIGDFPLNDDWQYAYPVMKLVEEGQFEMQGIFAPNIILQVAWGTLWCWIGGALNFTVLRFSTLALAILGSLLFFFLGRKLAIPSKISFIGTLILISSPLFFNLSFSFMTDVPFLSIMMATLLAVLLYIKENRLIWLMIACIFSVASFLIRQPGILVMPVLGLWIGLEKKGKGSSFIFFLALVFLGVATYLIYEQFAKPLIGISDNFVPVSDLYLDIIKENPLLFIKELLKKFVKTWIYLGFFSLPILPFVWHKVRHSLSIPYWQLIGIFIGNVLLLFYLHQIEKIFPFGGNILYNLGLGPELLVDTYTLQIPNTPQIPSYFLYILNFISQLSATLLFLIIWRNRKTYTIVQKRFFSFLVLLSLVYIPVMSITSFFDRYLLLPIASFFLILLPLFRFPKTALSYVPMIAIALFSLLATHDYMSWNRAKHEAFLWLQEQDILITQMDAGVEYNGFYNYHSARELEEGKSFWWVTNDNWVISFGAIPGYEPKNKVAYRRWLWGGRKDYIHILQKSAIQDDK